VTRTRIFPIVAVLVSSLALASCSHPAGRGDAPTSTSGAPRREVLVSIGSGATFGDDLENPLRDAWPQLLYHDAFPRSTVFVNASDRSVTVASALGQPLSIAIEVHATVVAVWLGDLDLDAGVPPSQFEGDLDRLVTRLRGSGARVLLGNLPGTKSLVYNNAIARVARTHRAALVDLATALSGHPDAGPSRAVDAATSRTIADAFRAALARS
jgi:hypothetical protein